MPPGAKTIDGFVPGANPGDPAQAVVSAKTINLNAPGYAADPGDALASAIGKPGSSSSYAGKLFQLEPGDVIKQGPIRVDIGPNTQRILSVGIPSNVSLPAQTIDALQKYWASQGITITLKRF